MHLLGVGWLILGVGFDHAAVRVILAVIFGRAQVNPGVAAGTLPGFGLPALVRPRRSLVRPRLLLIRLRLLLCDRPASEKKENEGDKSKPTHR
jgi:hypothetical protein